MKHVKKVVYFFIAVTVFNVGAAKKNVDTPKKKVTNKMAECEKCSNVLNAVMQPSGDSPLEIELKLFDYNDNNKKIKDWLEKNAKKGKLAIQTERYIYGGCLAPTMVKYKGQEPFNDALLTLRLRVERDKDNNVIPGKVKLTHKRRFVDDQGRTVGSRVEMEASLLSDKDADTVAQILKVIGFPEEISFTKNRQKYEVSLIEKVSQKRLTIEAVVDFVKELGEFIEFEVLDLDGKKELFTKQEEDIALRGIYQLLMEVGLKKAKFYDRSYPHMLWNGGREQFEVTRDIKKAYIERGGVQGN